MDSSAQSRKRWFFSKSLQSRSFPRTVREDAAFATAESEAIDSPLLAYTSLRDLMSKSSLIRRRRNFLSRSLVMQSAREIPISNFLVQKAAWAYLQPIPVSTSTSSSSNKSIWHRVWDEVRPPVNSCINFINRHVILAITEALVWIGCWEVFM
jgi:hypothetical protein